MLGQGKDHHEHRLAGLLHLVVDALGCREHLRIGFFPFLQAQLTGVVELVKAIGGIGVATVEEAAVGRVDRHREIAQALQLARQAVLHMRRQHVGRVHAARTEDVLRHAGKRGKFAHPGTAAEGVHAHGAGSAGARVGLEHAHAALGDVALGEVGRIEGAFFQHLHDIGVKVRRMRRGSRFAGSGGTPFLLGHGVVAHRRQSDVRVAEVDEEVGDLGVVRELLPHVACMHLGKWPVRQQADPERQRPQRDTANAHHQCATGAQVRQHATIPTPDGP